MAINTPGGAVSALTRRPALTAMNATSAVPGLSSLSSLASASPLAASGGSGGSGMMGMLMMLMMFMMMMLMGGGGSGGLANLLGGKNGNTGDSSSSGGSSNPGGSSGGPGSSDNSGGALVSGAGIQETPAMARLAAQGKSAAANRNSHGMCLAGVQDALQSFGCKDQRLPSAYMKADQLAGDPNFKEVKVSANDLKNLPPGCIIVWNRSGDGSAFGQHGHIQITQGGGKATSDHFETISNLGTSFRVFIPQG